MIKIITKFINPYRFQRIVMPYGPEGKLVTPPFTRPILIVTVWDAVALLWKYIISRPPRKEFMKQAAYLEKMRSILVDKILEMGGDLESLSICDKFHIFRSEEENQELLFRGIASWQVWRNEGRENTGIRKCQGSIEAESGDDGINIFKCQNQKKIGESLLGPVLRIGALEGSSWKENYPKTSCYFVYPDRKPKWTTNTSMFPVSIDNRFDSSGNNPSLFLEMLENVLDRYLIANFLDIKLQSIKSDDHLQKDNIRLYAMDIALCGFNHIIVIGETYCGLLFLDCYGRIFKWDAMTDALVFYGNIFKESLGKSRGVLWGVSGDGSVWELSGIYAYFACSLS
ncbi:hypothetical protein C1646_810091 [Rhizophagus diaphanus]|nr:hypothetical protein C1646_810091 [Rhizophagus diaphanus] [Rhizophagus sp. MUCL 43196]